MSSLSKTLLRCPAGTSCDAMYACACWAHGTVGGGEGGEAEHEPEGPPSPNMSFSWQKAASTKFGGVFKQNFVASVSTYRYRLHASSKTGEHHENPFS